jgi:Ca-activated chloride channel homolog
MRIFVILFLLSLSFLSLGQITSAQQKALNSYVDYANQSAEEVTGTVKSIIAYYPTIRQKRSWGTPRFTCPVQLDEYYWNTATTQTKA